MRKLILAQFVFVTLLVGQLSFAGKYEGASSRLLQTRPLQGGFEDFQIAVKELYFACAQAKDEASCAELSKTQICTWALYRRVLKNVTTFSGVKEFIAYNVDAHCSVDYDFVLKQQDVGSLIIMVPVTMVLPTLFWVPIWQGYRDVELYFYAAASSGLVAALLYMIWESTKMHNVLVYVHRNATLGL